MSKEHIFGIIDLKNFRWGRLKDGCVAQRDEDEKRHYEIVRGIKKDIESYMTYIERQQWDFMWQKYLPKEITNEADK